MQTDGNDVKSVRHNEHNPLWARDKVI